MLQRSLLVVFVMMLLAGLVVRPEETVLADPDAECGGDFRPLADAAIDQSAADAALGETRVLQVRAASRDIDSLLDFAVDLDDDVAVHSARLELTVSGGSLGRDEVFLVSHVLEPWEEHSVTWNSQPLFRPGRERSAYALERDKLSLDVTTLVRTWQANRAMPQSFIIQGLTEGLDVTFYSREEPDAARQPRLTIRCNPRRQPPPPDRAELDGARQEALDQLRLDSARAVDIRVRGGAVHHAAFSLALPPAAGDDIISQAGWLLAQQKTLLGLEDPAAELQLARVSPSGDMVFYRQLHQGIPVYGAYVGVRLHDREARSFSGNYLPSFSAADEAVLTALEAEALALELAGPLAVVVGQTQLRYFNPAILGEAGENTYLAWLVNLEVDGAPMGYLLDADSGRLHFVEPRVEDLDLAIYDTNGKSKKLSCTDLAQYSILMYTEDGKVDDKLNADATFAWQDINATYNTWFYNFGLLSYDGNDGKIWMYVDLSDGSASSNKGCLKFKDQFVEPDIVGHEFTHSVDSYAAKLIYKNQSGALDESFADIFGHFVDYEDWLIGEGTPGGEFRDLSNPPAFSSEWDLDGDDVIDESCTHPDHFSDYCVTEADNGGVHVNSGIHNKVAYLLTDGDVFNGYDIPGIGSYKAMHLFYHVLRGCLSSSSQFMHARECAVDTAQEWVDEGGSLGFNAGDVCQIRNAYAAVGLGSGDSDCDGIPNNQELGNVDGDSSPDDEDNCVFISNSSQSDADKDGQGDACDENDDNDSLPDESDNCDLVANDDQADWNDDGEGDVCDDTDLDKVVDATDNCVTLYNYGQKDADGDGVGDACDLDIDGDGIPNFPEPADNCPLIANPLQENDDLDNYGDACDLCPGFFSSVNTDYDHDGLGDPCDPDDDGDDVDDSIDNCLFLYNPDQADFNENGIGFHCDQAEQNLLEQPIDTAVFIPEGLPFEVPVLLCPGCGGQRLPLDWRVNIDFSLDAAAYAQVIDSQGEVIARSLSEAGVYHDFVFSPALFSQTAVAADAIMDRAATSRTHDGMGYMLQIFPLEDPAGNRNYTLNWTKEQGQSRFTIYLPAIVE